MRQIEKDMLSAISQGRSFKQANTEVYHAGSITEVHLHGHLIARRDAQDAQDSGWAFNLCGWNTPTTRSRLNALGAHVSTKAGQPHVMGRPVPETGWFK